MPSMTGLRVCGDVGFRERNEQVGPAVGKKVCIALACVNPKRLFLDPIYPL